MSELGLASTCAAEAVDPLERTLTAGEASAEQARGEARGEQVQGGASAETATDAETPRRRAAAELPIRRLAHFVVDEKLGSGGMGEVYRGRDLSLGRDVAIKLLPERVSHDPGLRSRFVSEARAQARIRHPNVCHIYFIGEEEGRLFFAMELVQGETLSARLERQGALDPDDALDIAIGVARGLRAAAAEGFIHRDIKPSNVMVTSDGAVKILDFGLVRLGPVVAGEDGGVDNTRAAVGTPLYMSPEQSRGQIVDHRSDIYSLGATLHQLVAGAPPFSATTFAQLASAHASEARPKIRKQRRKAPRTSTVIDELCDRMMAKEPGDRFDSYDQLIAALEQASSRRTPTVRALPRWLAFLVDVVAVAFAVKLLVVGIDLVLGFSGLELQSGVNDVLLVIGLIAYYPIAYLARGRTVGMAAFHLILQPTDGGERPNLRQIGRRLWMQWGVAAIGLVLMTIGLGRLDLDPWDDVRATIALIGIALVGLAIVRVLLLGVWARRNPRQRTRWDQRSRTEIVLDVSSA